MKYIKLFEQFIQNIPPELQELAEIAKQYDDSYEFSDKLNFNKLNHDKENAFLGERFERLNRGYTLDELDGDIDLDNEVTIYRTGDQPIRWGDYVYLKEEDVKNAYEAGQGSGIFTKEVTYDDLIAATQGSGEFFYSPKHLRQWGNDLVEFWYNVHGKEKPDKKVEQEKDDDEVSKEFKEKVFELLKNTDDFDEFYKLYFNLANDMKENPFYFDVDELWYDYKVK